MRASTVPISATTPSEQRWGGVVAAAVTVLVWTSFIVIARASADPSRGAVLAPWDIALCRIVGASVILLPWSWWLTRGPGATNRTAGALGGLSPLPWPVLVRTGFFGGLMYAVLAYQGFVYAPAAHASVLMPGSLPLWTSLLAWALLGESINRGRLLGLACIVGGDLLVGGGSLLLALQGGTTWRGDLLFMGAAFSWACYSVMARRYQLDAVRATMAVTAFAALCFIPLYAVLVATGLTHSRLAEAPWSAILFQATYQGWGSVVISGISFTKMIQHFGPVRSTMITALVPGLSALAAVAVLGEPLHLNLLLGLALVTLGILFGVRSGRSQ